MPAHFLQSVYKMYSFTLVLRLSQTRNNPELYRVEVAVRRVSPSRQPNWTLKSVQPH